MTNPNSNDLASRQQIHFVKSRGVRVPVKFEIYKHGGGIYLTVANPAEGVNVALVASAAEMAATLRRAADQIEAAVKVNDQGHISRTPAPQTAIAPAVGPHLNPGATNWDWLPPERVIQHFQETPGLSPMADDVKAALKGQIGLPAPAPISRPLTSDLRPPTASQLDLDLAAIQPHLDRIVRNGKINKSEIARILKITPGGSGNWERLVAIEKALKKAA